MGIPTQEMMNAHEGRERESLVYEVESLRARVKELEEALSEAEQAENEASRSADIQCMIRYGTQMQFERAIAERDAALDALHALAEWVDAVKADIEEKRQFFDRNPGRSEEDGYYNNGAENAAAQCGWLFEGGWDATRGEE